MRYPETRLCQKTQKPGFCAGDELKPGLARAISLAK